MFGSRSWICRICGLVLVCPEVQNAADGVCRGSAYRLLSRYGFCSRRYYRVLTPLVVITSRVPEFFYFSSRPLPVHFSGLFYHLPSTGYSSPPPVLVAARDSSHVSQIVISRPVLLVIHKLAVKSFNDPRRKSS